MSPMLWLRAHSALAASALCLLGCSGEPTTPLASAGTATGGNAGGAAVGGGGSGGAAGQGGGAAGTQAVSSGGNVACDTFADDTGYQLTVHIKNERSETLYLGPDDKTCTTPALYEVEDGARTKLPALAGCVTSCQAMMVGAAASCPTVCAEPSTVALEPGQTIDLPWDGRYGVPQNLPSQCMKDPAQGGSCTQAQKIEAGVFTFVARAGTKRSCLLQGGTCSCAANAHGGCTAPSSVIAGTIYTSEFLIALEPAEAAPGGEPQYIEIVFR
jgi:hypothetical protein